MDSQIARKDLADGGHDLFQCTVPEFIRRLRKTMKIVTKKARGPAEIRTDHFPLHPPDGSGQTGWG